MPRRISVFLSWIFHPLFIPAYGIFLIFHYNTYLNYSIDEKAKMLIYIIVILSTLILPAISTFLLLKQGHIKSLEMESAFERKIPFLATAVFYTMGYWFLKELPLPRLFHLMIMGATVSVIAAVIINFRWKISVHMIGMGGIVGVLMGMSQLLLMDLRFPIIISLLSAGLLGTARLSLQAHTPAQIYTGFLVGFLCEFLILRM